MKNHRAWTLLMMIAIGGAGIQLGRFIQQGHSLRGLAHHPTCASSKQFLVQFGLPEFELFKVGGPLFVDSAPLEQRAIFVEVDGDAIGTLYEGGLPLRRYFCEGNHEATIRFNDKWRNDAPEVHEVNFALSRASHFNLTKLPLAKADLKTCVSGDCSADVGLSLSAYDPDDPRFRGPLPTQH